MRDKIAFLVMLSLSGAAANAQRGGLLPVTVVNVEVLPEKPVDGALVEMTTLGGLNAGAHGKSKTNEFGKTNVVLGEAGRFGDRQQITVLPPASAAELVVYEPADGLIDALPPQLVVKMLPKRSELLKGPAQVEARLKMLLLQIDSADRQNRMQAMEVRQGEQKLVREHGLSEALQLQNDTLTERNQALTTQVQQQQQKLAEKDDLTEAIQEWARETGFSPEELEQTVRGWVEDIKRKGQTATLEQQALAEFALRHYLEAGKEFYESSAIHQQRGDAIDKNINEQVEQRNQEWTVSENEVEQAAIAYRMGYEFEKASELMQATSEELKKKHIDHPNDTQVRNLWLMATEALTEELMWEGKDGHMWDPNGAPKRAAAMERSVQVREELVQDYKGIGDRLGAASIESNLSDVYRTEADATADPQERRILLGKAMNEVQSALNVQTKEKMGQAWAGSQLRLGITYYSLGQDTKGKQGQRLLEKAVEAEQQCVEVFSNDKEVPPWVLGRAWMNLGNAFDDLGWRARDREEAGKLWGKAVKAYQEALKLETKEEAPHDRAETQGNLGLSYFRRGVEANGEDAHELLENAAEAYEDVLEVTKKDELPHLWVDTHIKLAKCFVALARQEEDSGRSLVGVQYLRFAREALESASEVDPELQDSIQEVDVELMRVASGGSKEQ